MLLKKLLIRELGNIMITTYNLNAKNVVYDLLLYICGDYYDL